MELIEIIDETYGPRQKKPARKVTNSLAIAFSNVKYDDRTFKIYSINAHRQAIPHRIATFDDAVAIARFLDQMYHDYWDVHQNKDWWQASIPQLCQFTVPDGVEVFSALQSLEEQDTITLADLEKALKASNG